MILPDGGIYSIKERILNFRKKRLISEVLTIAKKVELYNFIFITTEIQ
jgi:hypothetical protein